MRALTWFMAAGLAATGICGLPRDAKACGGTFCDAGPTTMPVDQTGENVLFVIDDGWVEAHIQIQYTGDPEQFAWIVPVMAVPEVKAGSEPLFDNLLAATVPTFTLQTRTEDNCNGGGSGPGGGGGLGCGMMASDAAAGWSDDDLGGDDGEDEPEVVVSAVAGAYEYAVLEGGTVEGITAWLDENGFARDDQAPEILQDYIDDGFLFVAFKLQAGAGIDEIHPVVLRYEGTEPCVPLRLTRIAAKDDMGVRVFFLGEHRVVPTNFRHVTLNPLKIDWLGLGANYEQAVTLAVDEEGSEGHGFVTEYAGTSNIVSTSGIYSSQWSSAAFLDLEPRDLTEVLIDQGLLSCGITGCFGTHPLLPKLLQTHFPPPAGVPEEVFYACTSCYENAIDEETWDGVAFAADFEERIVGPGEAARDALATHDYLTRLYTTISPAEMTEDPLFHENADLADVSNSWDATQVIDCEGPDHLELADGREIWFDEDDVPPTFPEMPWAETAETIAYSGAPMPEADRSEEIDAELDDWNDEQSGDGGCGCKLPKGKLDGPATLGLLLLMGVRARRRRRRAA